MPDRSLLDVLADVRDKTLRLLEPVTEVEALWSPGGLQNHILWHAGHAVVVTEHLGPLAIDDRPPSYPAGWHERFSWSSNPANVTSWPTLAEVVAELTAQRARHLTILAELSDAQLARVIDAKRNRTLRQTILHGYHDEACHQGEIWLLRKLIGVRGE